MIKLKPTLHPDFNCPFCGSESISLLAIRIPGMSSLADCRCEVCSQEFYIVLPVGHTSDQTMAIDKETGKIFKGRKNPEWLNNIIQSTVNTLKKESVTIRKEVFIKTNRVIILNALDYIYGHALLKLLNANYHLDHHQEFGLIVIIPSTLEWMIPKGCAEAWVVNLKLGDLAYSYEAIQEFISQESNRFDEIYLSKAYSHPDQTTIDIKRFTGIAPFDLYHFSATTPHITFIVREDRWWYDSKLSYWFYRFCRWAGKLSWGGRILAFDQNRLIKNTIEKIKAALPDAKISIAGFGKTGDFDKSINDKRSTHANAELEKEWCRLYAQSHVVVGVHGSNMLLPTAFAAGCVEILPEGRYGNIVQDLFVRYADRRQLFMYRIDDQYTTPEKLARKITSIILEFDRFQKNMVKNIYTSTEIPSRMTPHEKQN
jgi:hypothetical protein